MKKRKKTNRSKGRLQIITLCISTAMVLVLLGLVVFTGLTAQNLTEYVKEKLTVTIVFDGNVSNQQASLVCKKLKNKPFVANIDYISKEQALKEQTEAMGTDPSEFLGENPFTPSAEISLKADYANADSVKNIVKMLKTNKQIEEVTYQQDLMDSVNTNLRKIMLVMVIIAALLAFVSFTLISNTVRLTIFARRFSINTMKLVGASWSFIRAPFIKMGIVEGVLAALLADAALAGCYISLYNFEPSIAEVVTIETLAITAGSVFLFGIIITTFCVYISVNHFLKMKAKDLYKL